MNVRKLKISFIIGVLLMGWLTGWGFRKEITVQDTNVDGNLTDFPAYVDVTTDADFHEARSDGYDIRFTQSDGETLLKYEREYWTGGNGSAATAHFWVKVPSILASGGATIYCYYGKSDAGDGEDAANVWDANFKAVYHLRESGNGTDDEFKDSSGNANHGTGGGQEGSGDSAKTPDQIDGQIYKGNDFELSTTDHIGVPNHASLLMSTTVTLEAWIKQETNATSKVLSKNYQEYEFGPGSTNRIHVWYGIDGGHEAFFSDNNELTTGTWYHIAATVTSSDQILYKNGVSVKSAQTTNTVNMSGHTYGLLLGARSSAATSLFDGILDEVRISDSERSVEWLNFTYHNTFEDDNELTWGNEETSGVDYSLVVDAGSFALTGQIVGILKDSKLAIEAGVYAEAGQAASLLKDSKIPIEAGSYAEAGQIASLLKDSKLAIGAGSYALSGQIANLIHAYTLAVEAGSFALTGQDVSLLRGLKLLIESGAYELDGQDVELRYRVTLFKKAVAEAIGVREKKLRSKREYSEGEDIITRILSSIWTDIDKKETTWESTKKIQKDE